jgi:class 3 adenylate cyclase
VTGMDKAVLVTDMSSFTSSTESRGIIHVGAKIFALRELLLPIMRSYGGQASAEADNCRAIFDGSRSALAAAFACKKAVDEYNAKSPDWGHLELDGLGIDWGKDVQSQGHTMVGSVVDSAFQLAENIASNGQVLVTPSARESLDYMGCDLTYQSYSAPELLSTDGQYYDVTSSFHLDAPIPPRPIEYEDNDERLLAKLCRQRRAPGADIAKIDGMIRDQFIQKRTALLYDILPEDRLSLSRQLEIRHILRRVAHAYGGRVWDDDDRLLFFGHPTDALATAIEAHHRLMESGMPVRSFGIDHGEVLAIEGTVVHWGSPVNTAAKLSEEIAKPGEILISDRARFQIHRQMSILRQCAFSARESERSGVKFEHWDVGFTPTNQFMKMMLDIDSQF